MIEWHNFHFKIDGTLLREIDLACVKLNIASRDNLINYILGKMGSILDVVDLNPSISTIHDDVVNFDRHINIKIEPQHFNRLKYLHFRFGTFSIATILRRVLRLYLILCDKIIDDVIEIVKKYLKSKVWFNVKFKKHMHLENPGNTRILTIDDHFQLENLFFFT